MSVDVILKNSCKTTGEGPHWDETTQSLLYVDIESCEVHRWNSQTGVDEVYKFDETVSFIVPCRKGGYLIGLGLTVSHFDWETKKVTVLHTVGQDKKTRFNDGKCDASGRLWCGTMAIRTPSGYLEPKLGALYSVEVDGSIKKHKSEINISNGLAWTEDNNHMYYIDSFPRKLFSYDFDIDTGTMSNERVAVDFGGQGTVAELGNPDGMAIDTEGKLWVACYRAAKLIRFDPETGKPLTTVSIPASKTTSCCFGGKNFDELYVTSSAYRLTEEERAGYPLAGSVFRVTGLGVKGKPAPVYEGR